MVKWEEVAALTACSYGDVLGEVKRTDFLSFPFYISFFLLIGLTYIEQFIFTACLILRLTVFLSS